MSKSDEHVGRYLPGRGRARLHRVDRPRASIRPSSRSRRRPSPKAMPILDRAGGRVLAALAAGPAADRRGRHGLRLLDAVDGPRPAARRDDRDHRPGPGADRPGPGLVAPGRASPTSRSRSSTGRPSRPSRPAPPSRPWPGPSTSSSSTRSRTSTSATSTRSGRGSRRARSSSPTTCSGAGRVARPELDPATGAAALRAFNAAVLADPALRRDDPAPSATACSSPRFAVLTRVIAVRVRLFAIQRELAGRREVEPRAARRRLDRGGLDRARRRGAGPRPRPVVGPLRPERGLRRARRGPGRRRRAGLHPAGQRRRRIRRRGTGSSSCASAPFGLEILAELGDRLATDADGAICGFIGRTRATAGTAAPGQEAEAARHAGRRVEALEYEAHEEMVRTILETIADEVEAASGSAGSGSSTAWDRCPWAT